MQPALPPVLKARYRLLQHLGRGGMATVYRAYDETLARQVAVKILKPDILLNEKSRQRFVREARLLAGLVHPNIIHIYDSDIDADWHFLVLELVDGYDAAQVVAENPHGMDAARAETIIRGTLAALAFAHERGIIHRDIKPQNVLLKTDGSVKVGDFGLARLLGDVRLTQDDTLPGTVMYMSPEIFLKKDVDHRADLYAAGAMWYELLTGQPPFMPDTPVNVIASALHTPAPRLTNVPPALRDIVDRLLAKEPGDRFGSANEVLAALDESRQRPEISANEAPTLTNEVALYAAHEARSLAVEAERKRLAEMLDGQLLNALAMLQAQAAMYEQSIANHEARMVASVLGTLARQAVQQVRDFSANLHPTVLERLGLEAALEYLAEQTRRTAGLQINLMLEHRRERLPAALEIALFRMAQAAVERAVQHTRVPSATLSLRHQPPVVMLVMRQPGQDMTGLDGLQAARDWIEHLNGTFAFQRLDEATELTVTVRHQPPVELTAREMDVLLLVVEGLSNKEIARRLSLSPRTVNFHLDNIYSKLGVNSRTEAAIYALRQGWTKHPG